MSTGLGRVYKRGDTWWIDYGYRGKRYRESSRSTIKRDARERLRRRLKEIEDGRFVGPSEESVTFEDLTEIIRNDYKVQGRKSLPRLQTALGHLAEHFGGEKALAITTDRLNAYILTRRDEGAADATIQKEMAALKRAFNLARQAGRLSNSAHIPALSVQNVRQGFLTMADVEAVASQLDASLRPIARFGALTGWRKGEIVRLRWRQVDFDAGVVRLDPGTTKNDEGREFPFHVYPQLKILLQEQRERTDAVEKSQSRIVPWVFHRNGRPIKSLEGAWRGACKRAGLEGAWFHDLRRTAVRNLERAGVSRSVATKLTGHKTESVYLRYAITDKAVMEEGVQKLARFHARDRGESAAVSIRHGT
jgi:integrase